MGRVSGWVVCNEMAPGFQDSRICLGFCHGEAGSKDVSRHRMMVRRLWREVKELTALTDAYEPAGSAPDPGGERIPLEEVGSGGERRA